MKAPDSGPETLAAKADGARRAAGVWRRASAAQRVAALRAVWRSVAARRAEAIAVIREETGKPALEAELVEFGAASLLAGYSAANAERVFAERSAWTSWLFLNKRAAVRRRPYGVVGIIAPWNMPFLVPFGDAFCAMLAGNAALVKPSEWATRTALWMESAVAATGLLPEGLLSVVPGGAATGEGVIDASDLVLFTGSTATGRAVARRAAEQLKPAILELGGKHAMIVCADAPLDRAAAGAVWGGLSNNGQSCVAVERIYVEEAAHDALVERLRAGMEALRVGDGDDAQTGRFAITGLLDRVQLQLADARAKGARVLGGEPRGGSGLLMAPALVLDARPDMAVMSEETFGPVLAVMRIARAEEGVEHANAGRLGLSASVWSGDAVRAWRLAASLDAGAVGVNEPGTHYAHGALPFGGVKSSGIGRRHGDEGLLALTQAQSVLAHEWPAAAADPWWFPGPRAASWMRWLLGLP